MARISMNQWRRMEGLTKGADFVKKLQELTTDSVCPALCDEGCEVEPDGECEHECPSVLIEAGLI